MTPPASGTLPETQVRAMFDRIAHVYDRMNSVMTAGMHHLWRRRAADLARVGPGSRALDVATGTGDLAVELSARGAEVVGLDFSERMLELARAKAQRIPNPVHPAEPGASGIPSPAHPAEPGASGIPNPAHPAEPGASGIPSPAHPAEPGASGIEFVQGNALEIAYPDASFDAVTVGFGARNFADLDRGLSELARVTRPGGRVVILEITTPQKPPLSWFFRFWFDRAVPALGRLAGDPDAYSYLPSSVRRFPGPRELAERLAAAGLEDVRWVLTAGGIIAIHAGTRHSSPAHPAEPGALGGR